MPIDPENLDEKAVKSYRGGEESVTFRSGQDMQKMNEVEDAKAAASNRKLVFNFLNNYQLNLKSVHFPTYE